MAEKVRVSSSDTGRLYSETGDKVYDLFVDARGYLRVKLVNVDQDFDQFVAGPAIIRTAEQQAAHFDHLARARAESDQG